MTTTNTNTVVCISGMHRSGTSLFANWLQSCGLVIGDGNLNGPTPANPKGNWEDADFTALHKSALLRIDPDSKGWQTAEPGRLRFSESERETALAYVQKRNQKFKSWGWKDPRSLLFLDEWLSLVPDLKIVLTWRPADEVVNSLLRRAERRKDVDNAQISSSMAMRLWQTHNELARAYKRAYPKNVLLFPLAYVIENDAATIKRINEAFTLELKYSPIATLYDEKALASSKTPIWLNVSTRFMYSNLERELASISDTNDIAQSGKTGSPSRT